uniref:Insulin-like domain-containing protein n=1 Tax=Panagrolaimus sp. PS1159 TaxID=55785 RepID=A0AC35GR70_9BILA
MPTLWRKVILALITIIISIKALPFSMKDLQMPSLIGMLNTTPEPEQKFGTLKLCPPGGRSFFEAFQLACPMRRKRSPLFEIKDKHYRPATIDEIMKICCHRGCEFTDFFPHCGPFAAWK